MSALVDAQRSLAAKVSYGGSAPARVREQLALAREALEVGAEKPAASPRDRLPRPSDERATLPCAFFGRPVVEVAHDLLGCTFLYGGVGGRVVEVEAYRNDDPASHTYRGRTPRNAVMFGPPGRLYVYFTMGLHFCVNVVCQGEGEAAAILLRALEPTVGLETMRERRGTGGAPAALQRTGQAHPGAGHHAGR